MTDDELEQRLRAADPSRAEHRPAPPATWIDDLVEATMTSTADQTTTRRWLVPAGIAAAAAGLAVGGYALVGGGPQSGTDAGSTVRYALPADDGGIMSSCLPFSAEALAGMPVAFSGEVTEVTDTRVRLAVDHWYRGGDGGTVDNVVLTRPEAATAALLGSVEFAEGERYLVTAADGTVNSCGFTMPWSAESADVFDDAFSG